MKKIDWIQNYTAKDNSVTQAKEEEFINPLLSSAKS